MDPNDENTDQGAENLDVNTDQAQEPEANENQGAPAQGPPAEVIVAQPPVTPAPAGPAPVVTQAPENIAAANSNSIGVQLIASSKSMADKLSREPKVRMNLPLRDGEKFGVSYEVVNLNGYRLKIKKGYSVDLPMSIANILSEHYRIQLGTGAISIERSARLDSRDDKINALT